MNFVFKRKLEYDQRIYEQQLYIIRLALSILTQSEAKNKLKELGDNIQVIDEKYKKFRELDEQLKLY